jgi:hypothetical protein
MDFVSDSYDGVKKRETKNAGDQHGADLSIISDCDDQQQESHPDTIELDSSGFIAS